MRCCLCLSVSELVGDRAQQAMGHRQRQLNQKPYDFDEIERAMPELPEVTHQAWAVLQIQGL